MSLCPVLKIDGELIAEGYTAELGSAQYIPVTITTSGYSYAFSKEMSVGSVYTFVLDYQNIAAYKTGNSLNNIYELKDSISKNNLYSDAYLGKLLEYTGYSYFTQLDIFTSFIAENTNTYFTRDLSMAAFGYEPEITATSVGGTTASYSIKQSGDFCVDLFYDGFIGLTLDSNTENESKFKAAAGMMSSYLESSVLKDVFDTESVSAMEILNYAYANNIDVYTLYNGSQHSISELNINENARSIVSEALEYGYAVIIPQSDVTINNWTGSGYIVQNLESGYSQYMLSRDTASSGGRSTQGISFDQIIAIFASSLELVTASSALYGIMSAIAIGNPLLASVPGLGVMAFVTVCFVSAVENYIYTLSLVDAACSGDADAQAALAEQRTSNICSVGFRTAIASLDKVGGMLYNVFKTPKLAGVFSPEATEKAIRYSDDFFDCVQLSEELSEAGLNSDVVSCVFSFGDEVSEIFESTVSSNTDVIEILNAASDTEDAVIYLIEFADDAVANYIEVGINGIDALLDSASGNTADIAEMWNKPAFVRGKLIENYLADTEYSEWFHIGAEHNGFFPVIDFHMDKKIVSLKTLDPSSASYTPDIVINKIRKYAETLEEFKIYHGEVLCDEKILDIRVPKGTIDLIDMAEIQKINDEYISSKINLKIQIGEL